MQLFADRFPTPIGELAVVVNGAGAVVRIVFLESEARDVFERELGEWGDEVTWSAAPCAGARTQLEEFCRGERRTFDLELALRGTGFQMKVWDRLRAIPYGRTESYGEIARQVGQPDASRAVGRANHQNPIPIVIPCHRVVGSGADLVGFGGGLDTKRALLDLERGQTSFA